MFEQSPDYNISQSQSAPEQRHHLPIIILTMYGNKDMETNTRECLKNHLLYLDFIAAESSQNRVKPLLLLWMINELWE